MESQIEEESKKIRILVSENDLLQRSALVDILNLCNYEAVAVENGRFAHDELFKDDSCYDLVLQELFTPEMGGLELLQLMQSNEILKDIPVIIMSGDVEEEKIEECMRYGAKDYFIKPLKVQVKK